MNWNNLLSTKRIRESVKSSESDPRNEFESDFGRLMFSPAVRRMHDKTQVFPLTIDDNIHTRLTHSMEVMTIGYSLGLKLSINQKFQEHTNLQELEILRKIPIILQNACIVHDIGNPPFGHFGETVIQEYFKKGFKNELKSLELSESEKDDFRHFDGNAQGFRVLTKLQMLDDIYGLNLTSTTLACYTKYPNFEKIDKTNLCTKKRGIFHSEISHFKKIMSNCHLENSGKYRRHPLAFLMEASDSICYLVMDMEDGLNKQLYDLDFVISRLSENERIKSKIQKLETDVIDYGQADTKLARIRIILIQELVDLAIDNFINNITEIESGEYNKELIEDEESGLVNSLASISIEKIFPNKEIVSLELKGHSVITGLLDFYIDMIFNKSKDYTKRIPQIISSTIKRSAFAESDLPESSNISELSDYYKLKIILDYISGMTDNYALNQYIQLSGKQG